MIRWSIFGGILLTVDLKRELYKNKSFELARIEWQSCGDDLITLSHHGDEYLGQFFSEHSLPLDLIEQQQQSVINKVLPHLNNIESTDLTFTLIPQERIS